MYKQFLYCLTLTMSMSHLSAATRAAYAPVEQEEDDRGTLTKVVDFVCDAAPYFMSLGALWFCYSMHQTHDKHAADLKKHGERLDKVEKADKDLEGAKRAHANDLAAIQRLQEQANTDAAAIRVLQERLDKQAADGHAHAAPKPISIPVVGAPASGVTTPEPVRSRAGSAASNGSSGGFEEVNAGNGSGDEAGHSAGAPKPNAPDAAAKTA